MEVILRRNIRKLGYTNDIVEVKSGYARNYLIPQGYALVANSSNKKMAAEIVRQIAHKEAKIKNVAKELAERIGATTLKIGAKFGTSGKLFGSITPSQIVEKLSAEGINIDRKKIIMKDIPKQPGSYTVIIDLHKEIQHEIQIEVVAE